MTPTVTSSRPVRARIAATLAVSLGSAALLAGCSDGSTPEEKAGERTVTVLAAASLTDVFAELDADDVTDDLTARFSFGSSTALAEQAAQGAPGDVLATADRSAMDLAIEKKAVTAEPVEFASNRLVLVVPAANPAGITSLGDLAGTDWVRCADDVPCGRLALEVLGTPENTAALGKAKPVSLEPDVRSVLAKVTAAEADAGLVYLTDAVAAGDAVTVIDVPGAETMPTSYWVAPLADGDQEVAQAWIAALTSTEGEHLLDAAGFDQP